MVKVVDHNFETLTTMPSDIVSVLTTARTKINSDGLLVTLASGVARLGDHLFNGTVWVNKGLGIWQAYTNICLQSRDLLTTWTNPGANTTITANQKVDAAGNTTLDDVLHNDSAETVQQTITVTANTVVTISGEVRQGNTGNHDWVKLSWLDESTGTNGFEVWFDRVNGVVGTAQAVGTGSYTSGSAALQNLSGGLYRVSASGQIVSGQTDGRIELINTTADAVNTAETTNSVAWGGFDVTETSFVAPHIDTTTAAVAVSADIHNQLTSTISGFSQTTGTFYLKALENVTGANKVPYSIHDGTSSDLFGPLINGGRAAASFSSSAGNNGFVFGAFSEWGTVSRQMAVAFAENDIYGAFEGAAMVGTPTDSTYDPSTDTLTSMSIGSNFSNSSNFWNGPIARIALFNTRQTNGEVDDLSINGPSAGGGNIAADLKRRRIVTGII